MVQSDPWEGVSYTPTSSGSTRARRLADFQAAVAARTRGLGGEDLRVALEEALAALVVAALGVLALSGLAALVVLVWRAVL